MAFDHTFIQDEDVLLSYAFDESSGTRYPNQTITGHNLVLDGAGSVGASAGKSGLAAEIYGPNSDVDLTSQEEINKELLWAEFTSGYAIGMWIYIGPEPNPLSDPAACQGALDIEEMHYAGETQGDASLLEVEVYGDLEQPLELDVGYAFDPAYAGGFRNAWAYVEYNAWYYILCLYDHIGGVHRTYVNGTLIDEAYNTPFKFPIWTIWGSITEMAGQYITLYSGWSYGADLQGGEVVKLDELKIAEYGGVPASSLCNGLIAHYKMQEAVAGVVPDYTTHADLQLWNDDVSWRDIPFVPGKLGNAANSSASPNHEDLNMQSDYFDPEINLEVTGGVSIAAWLYVPTPDEDCADAWFMVDLETESNPNAQTILALTLDFYSYEEIGGPGHVLVAVEPYPHDWSEETGNWYGGAAIMGMTTNAWHLVVAWIDFDTGLQYISVDNSAPAVSTGPPYYYGGRRLGVPLEVILPLYDEEIYGVPQGVLTDSVSIWGRVLAEDERTELWNDGEGTELLCPKSGGGYDLCFSEHSRIIGHWTLDEETGDARVDGIAGRNLEEYATAPGQGAGKLDTAIDISEVGSGASWIEAESAVKHFYLGGVTGWTMACWIYLEPGGTRGKPRVKLKYLQYVDGEPIDKYIIIEWDAATYKLKLQVDTEYREIDVAGGWTFVMLWYDGVAECGYCQINNGGVLDLFGSFGNFQAIEVAVEQGDSASDTISKVDSLSVWAGKVTADGRELLYNDGVGFEWICPFVPPTTERKSDFMPVLGRMIARRRARR